MCLYKGVVCIKHRTKKLDVKFSTDNEGRETVEQPCQPLGKLKIRKREQEEKKYILFKIYNNKMK